MFQHLTTNDQVIVGRTDFGARDAPRTRHGRLFIDIEDVSLVPMPLEGGVGAIPSPPIQNTRRIQVLKNVVPGQFDQFAGGSQCLVAFAESGLVILAQTLIVLAIVPIVQPRHFAVREANIQEQELAVFTMKRIANAIRHALRNSFQSPLGIYQHRRPIQRPVRNERHENGCGHLQMRAATADALRSDALTR
ncbi:hypothetical protein D3C72_1456690 [compost metagenome]